MTFRIVTITFLLGMGLMAGAAGPGPARGPAQSAMDEMGVFRLTPESWPPPEGGGVHPVCSGIFLAPGVALTAAHCLEGHETHLTLICRDTDDRFLIETVRLARQARHPSEDLALAVFAAEPSCRVGTPPITGTLSGEERFFVRRAPPEVADIRRYMPQAALSATSVSLRDEEVCLHPEDAGTPLFVAREEGRAVLAGLLIEAPGRCQGDLTFLRLDGLRGWIEAERAATP